MDKKYNAQIAEAHVQEQWREQETNHFEPTGDAPAFTIDTPPPTVSGSLHIGHVFSYTHTDLLARYKRLRGHRVFYPMGFDDNGLPTERYVEKKHKTKAHVVGRSAFIKLCQDEVQHSHKEFAALWQKMGLSIDWRYTYSTISDSSRKLAQENFLDLLEQNKVHRIATPALYCTTCSTSVAQAELDSEDRATLFNTILFKDTAEKTYEIATTRPELLPACVAVFYHPNDSRFTHLQGKTLVTPHYNVEVPCFPDENVDPEKGTGLVMCCTFGDQTDITWYQTHKLPLKQ
ncbi:MAG: class I tRNA ligase family protein, partial [Candidatus Dependentiae bacterium]